MKSSVLVIILPVAVATLIVVGVFGYKFVTGAGVMEQAGQAPIVRVPGLTGKVGIPAAGFSDMQTTEPIADLREEFEDTALPDTSDLEQLDELATVL